MPTNERRRLAAELEAQLPLFTGTENYHQLTLLPLLATNGVAYLADKAGAYWFIDIIASHQQVESIAKAPFQVWRLTVNDDDSAVVEMGEDTSEDGTTLVHFSEPGNSMSETILRPRVRHDITYTDFPLPTFDLWVEGNVVLLPSEH